MDVFQVSRAAAMWDDLSTEHDLTLHAALNESGEPVLTFFPTFLGESGISGVMLRNACAKAVSHKAFQNFVKVAELAQSPQNSEFELPGVTRSIPLSSKRRLHAYLDGRWDEKSGTLRINKVVTKRLERALLLRPRCTLKSFSFHFASRADARALLSAIAEVAPDTVTEPSLALCDFLGALDEKVATARSDNSWVACSSDEVVVFRNYYALAGKTRRYEKSLKASSLYKQREEKHTLFAAGLLLPPLSQSIASKQPRDNVDGAAHSALSVVALKGMLHEAPLLESDLVPHLDRETLLSLARRGARIHSAAPVRSLIPAPSMDRYSVYFGASMDEKVEAPSLAFATGLQAVLTVLLENRKPATAEDLGVRASAYDIRTHSSALPEIASWQIPVEHLPLIPAVTNNGTALSIACLKPALAFASAAVRRKAIEAAAYSQSSGFAMLSQALEETPESFERQNRSPSGRSIPYATQQIIAVFVRTFQVFPGVLGTLSMASTGQTPLSVHDGNERLWSATGLRSIFQSSNAVPELRGLGSFPPRALGEPAGLHLHEDLFGRRSKGVQLIAAVPRQDASVVVTFRPKTASTDAVGVITSLPERLLKALAAHAAFSAEVAEAIAEVELEPVFHFEIDGRTVLESDWLQAKRQGAVFLLPDGTAIAPATYDRCLEVYALRRKALARFGRITLSNLWTASRSEFQPGAKGIPPDEYLRMMMVKLEGMDELLGARFVDGFLPSVKECPSPKAVTLRPYQEWGVAWLLSRLALGVGACLADEMGLGKTLQAIRTIAVLLSSGPANAQPQKVLVVCPKTLLLNWKSEWQKFSPRTLVALVDGGSIPADAEVIVTSYSRLRMQAEEFAAVEWLCVVLDEAHQIKNPTTSQAEAVRGLTTRYRMALTGTPIENHARELWSLADWLNPGWLGPCGAFENYTRLARTGTEKGLMLAPIRSLLAPVLLRRLKADPGVALDLPPKIESKVPVDLTEEQRILYETIVLAALGAGSDSETAFARSSRYLKAVLHCKQVCSHPDLFLRGSEDDEEVISTSGDLPPYLRKRLAESLAKASRAVVPIHERSAKLAAFRERVAGLIEEQGGILVFTQSLAAGRLIASTLAELGVSEWEEIPFLTGALSAQARIDMVNDFQNQCAKRLKRNPSLGRGAPPVLLVSLKAGGLGLNLTGASHVLHFDRWWNPAAEDQATDRAHRIGQTNTVNVHHFESRGTIEQGIGALIESKRSLAADLLGAAGADDVSSYLRNDDGFLRLVDPEALFVKRRVQA